MEPGGQEVADRRRETVEGAPRGRDVEHRVDRRCVPVAVDQTELLGAPHARFSDCDEAERDGDGDQQDGEDSEQGHGVRP